MASNPPKPKVLISRESIRDRVAELGQQIAKDHRDGQLVLLGVLKGSFIFMADLARAIDQSLRIEFLGVASYGQGTTSSGAVQITQDLTSPIEGCDVLIVEDIVDTGLTAEFLMQQMLARRARSVRLCALLHKPSGMRRQVSIDYLGFSIEDKFVVGYGLDWAQRYRNLPDICYIEADPAP
jgi:hypoxanthine phosphoribosyltransferase